MTDFSKARYAFIDVETTGFDPASNILLEIALVVTDAHLNIIPLDRIPEKGFVFPVRLARELWGMDQVVIDMHTKSGLIQEIEALNQVEEPFFSAEFGGCPYQQVDAELEAQLHRIMEECGKKLYLAGFSPHFDRRWLKEWMPKTESALSYRDYNVSTIREFFEVNAPDIAAIALGGKAAAHRAYNDCIAAINAMREYSRAFAGRRI